MSAVWKDTTNPNWFFTSWVAVYDTELSSFLSLANLEAVWLQVLCKAAVKVEMIANIRTVHEE